MAVAANAVDALIKEYLIFRGFTKSLGTFELDVKNDKSKSFKVESIMATFKSMIFHNYDIVGLRKYWKYFDRCFFSQLGHDTYKVIKKLETHLLKLYIVHATQANKMDKVAEFFEKYTTELYIEDSWKEWFAIPFMKNPEQARSFSNYFTKVWQDSVILSLGNCLETVFNNISLPTLLNFEREKANLERLEEENIKLKGQVASYQKELIKFRIANSDKVNAETQTMDLGVELHGTERLKKSKSSESSSKTKFGWKMFMGTKDTNKNTKVKENKQEPKDDNRNLYRSSLDESALRKLRKSDNNTSNSSLEPEDENIIRPNEPTSDFYVALEDENDYSHNDTVKDNDVKSNTEGTSAAPETPFIVLSQDEFKEHSSPIISCKFSDNNNIVASLDLSGTLKIWQCYPSISSQSVTLRGDYVSLDWVPKLDGKLLLGKSNSLLSLYDVNQKRTLWETHVHSKFKRVNAVACSPVSAVAAVSVVAEPKKNTSSNQQQKMIIMKQYSAFNSSKGIREGGLFIWDLNTGQKKCDLSLDPYPVCIHSLSFNHNGTLLVTGGADGMIRLFDIQNNDCLIGWHAHSTNVLDVRFNPNETCMYSLDSYGKLAVWDINKVSSKIAEFPLHAGSTGIYHYGKHEELGLSDEVPCSMLISCDSEGQHMMTCAPSGLMMYQIKPADTMVEVMHIVSRCSEVLTLDWTSSPNCSTVMCGTKKGTIQISTLLKK